MTKEERTEKLALFDAEYHLGEKVVVGMDEAGRGPLAGPVVAAAVVLPKDELIIGIDDSKKLSEKKREQLYEAVIHSAIAFGVGIVDEKMIDEINILNAARKAFKLAYEAIAIPADIVLCDQISGLGIPNYIPIIKGDSKSYAIAAASIVAKVTRDRMMRDYDLKYPAYGFSRHKGYGTKAHIEAIRKYGVCEIHRKSFLTRIL